MYNLDIQISNSQKLRKVFLLGWSLVDEEVGVFPLSDQPDSVIGSILDRVPQHLASTIREDLKEASKPSEPKAADSSPKPVRHKIPSCSNEAIKERAIAWTKPNNANHSVEFRNFLKDVISAEKPAERIKTIRKTNLYPSSWCSDLAPIN